MKAETILSFDTSAAHCAAALLSGGKVWERVEAMDKGQAERLFPMLDALLADTGIGWADVTTLAVGTGPGNFTGVRIAVAAARGLALSLGIPAIGVTRLEALAHGQPRPVTVVEDARRGEVYVQRFAVEGPEPAQLMQPGRIEGPATGSAAPNSLSPTMSLCKAMIEIAATRLKTPQPRPAPFYLRGADAAPPSDPAPVIIP
ncbi:MAG: tRNA (adenosine(37)-N6)-threonylcarbamoyltransferase complex dimerization subunit type 1 TsaB [Paracoccaceae bacterium]